MSWFQHIYIEEEAYKYPTTNVILEKYPNATKIDIKNYKHIFNRPNQNFQAQKEFPKLILAVKKDNFLLKSQIEPGNPTKDGFHYNTQILNCIYNCDYCYLQGMFHSGNIVVFVNIEDFFSETEKLLADTPIYLSISQETDILAFEDIVPYASSWIQFAGIHPNLVLEIQTKSNRYELIQKLTPLKNVILTWTISPKEFIEKYEKNTPSLDLRLFDIQSALNDGWKICICIDPILRVKGWQEIYSNLIKNTFSIFPKEKIFDLRLGTIRFNTDFLKKIKKIQPNLDILYYPFTKVGKQSIYPEDKTNEMIKFISDLL